ncbi:hypothetical protein FACS1894184_09320 [Clostridia bacterium]|nr:hypothetical protein FACS1894184_09320 [Clostridia bacterium]
MILSTLKDHLGIMETDKDSVLTRCISGATEIAENGNEQMILSIAALLYQRRLACA